MERRSISPPATPPPPPRDSQATPLAFASTGGGAAAEAGGPPPLPLPASSEAGGPPPLPAPALRQMGSLPSDEEDAVGLIGLRSECVVVLRKLAPGSDRLALATSFIGRCNTLVNSVEPDQAERLQSCRGDMAADPPTGVVAELLGLASVGGSCDGSEMIAGDEQIVSWCCIFDVDTLRLEVWPSGRLGGLGSGRRGRGISFDLVDLPDDYHVLLQPKEELEELLRESWLYSASSAAELVDDWREKLFSVEILDEHQLPGPPRPVELWARVRAPAQLRAPEAADALKLERRRSIQKVRGRRMAEWLCVLDGDSPLEQKLEYLQEAAFNDHVKAQLRQHAVESSE
jgi:hypothetical protein